jgi:uncharacterized protein (DUF2147 family)
LVNQPVALIFKKKLYDMVATKWLGSLALTATILCSSIGAWAQDAIEKTWYNQEKTAKVKVFKATDGKYYGKIVWLKEPNNAQGKPRTDINNPKKEHQNDALLGLQMLKNFEKDGAHGYSGGTIYDPKNGKTYSCKMTLNGDKLDVRGYVGISLLGRTTTWTLAE